MPKPNLELAAYWQPHIEAWRASGLSARRFCRGQSIPYSRFLYWSAKQRPDAEAAAGTPNAFARVIPRNEGTAGPGLQVSLPGGMQNRGIDAYNFELVGRLLAQL